MSTLSAAGPVVLLGLSIVGAVTRARLVVFRRAGEEAANSVRVIASMVLIYGVVWGVASWGLHGWLHGLLPSWRLALAGVGLVTGGLGWVSAAVGGSVVYGLLDQDPELLLWWVVPILAGHLARDLSTTEARPPRLWGGRASRARYGDLILPPTPRDRMARLLHQAAGAVPLVLAFKAPSVWTVGLAVLITAQVWWIDHLMQRLPRFGQSSSRVSSTVILLAVCGLAATPAGAWAVSLWRAIPGPAWLVGGIALAVLDAFARVPIRQGVGGRTLTLVAPVLTVLDQLLRRGLFLYAAVVAFHPAPDLLPGVALLVCAEFVLMCLGAVAGEVNSLQGIGVSVMLRLRPVEQGRVETAWLYDGLLARPARPDYSFITILLRNGALSSMGRTPTGQGFLAFDQRWRRPMTEEQALIWVEIAEDAIQIADEVVLPRYPAAHLARFRRDQARARQNCHTTRALLYQYLNWRDDAITHWMAVADLADEAQAPNNAALGRGNAALILAARLGRPHDALRTMRDGPDLATLAAPIRRYSLTVYALIHLLLGEVDEARAVIRQAEAEPFDWAGWRALNAEQLSPPPLVRVPGMRRVLFKSLLVQESWIRAAAYGEPLRKVLPRDMALTPGMTEYLRATVLIHEERYSQAREVLVDAQRRAAAAGHLTWSYTATLSLADLAVRDDDYREGYRLLRRAIDALEEMRGRVLDADLRIGAGAEPHANPYERAALLLVTADLDGEVARPDAEAFELAERARSRVFIELLGGVTAQAVPAELRELAAAELSAAEEFGQALREGAADHIRVLRARLDATRRALRQSGLAGAQYADLREGRPISLSEVRDLLGDDMILAEFLVTDEGTLLFLVRVDEDEPEVVLLDSTRADLRAAADTLQGSWHDRPAQWQEPFRTLLEPLAEACAEGERICLVPHDVLHMVPLHAVELDGRPFGLRNPVSYLPSASTLRYCRSTAAPWADRRAVLLADSRADQPLVHARVQTSAIADLFTPRAEVLTGADVTRAAIDERVADVWHLACHGEFDDREPGRSGILLADGMLTAADLLEMRLGSEMVTLSACRTGLSSLASGDELIGLTRALIYAGASSVVVSLWSVDEISTSVLMEEFYRALGDGADRAAALSRAQAHVRTMTVRDAIDYCRRAAGHLSGAQLSALDWDIADLRAQAGDLAAAADAYTALAARHPKDALDHRRLLAAATRSRRAARHAPPPDYAATPYAHPYYWAAFIVVGAPGV